MNAKPQRGRGAAHNPVHRFTDTYIDYNEDEETGEKPSNKTRLIPDHPKSIITYNKSPDISFDASIIPYRGCEHGCIYCYARPYHEYLGYSSGLDFESKILVKYQAPELLKKELNHPAWKPQVVAMSGVTDIYQPAEKKLSLTRECLKVFADFRNPVSLITKNYMITRDLDILKQLNEFNCVSVTISVTTLDRDLCGVMEPRTSRPEKRLEAIRIISEAGIPVNVNVAPVIPGLTDHESAEILKEASLAGAQSASYIVLRLPYQVKDLFTKWLEDHFPDRKNKVINRIKSLREGDLNDTNWGKRMSGEGEFARKYRQLFSIQKRKYGLINKPELTVENFRHFRNEQMDLF